MNIPGGYVGTMYKGGGGSLGAAPLFSGVMQGGDYSAGADSYVGWLGRSRMRSAADGFVTFYNNAETGFTGLRLGGTTASFVMLKRNGTSMEAKLASDSAYCTFLAGSFGVGGNSSANYGVNGAYAVIGDGTNTLGLHLNGVAGVALYLGAIASAGAPAIKRNGAIADFKLSDDSAFAKFRGRYTKRVGTTASNATPSIDSDAVDLYTITALAAAITSVTVTGTPTDGQSLVVSITDNGTARAIAWGASFEASTVALPTTTVISTRLDVGFIWNTVTSKWRCVAVA